MTLFIDIENKKLVQSLTSERSVVNPAFMQGDNEPLIIHLLERGTDSLFSEKSLSLESDSLKVAIARFAGEPKLLTYASEYTLNSDGGAIVLLPLNTKNIEIALQEQASIPAYLEVEYTKSDGSIITVLQTPCTLKNDLIENAPNIELQEQFYSAAKVDELINQAVDNTNLSIQENKNLINSLQKEITRNALAVEGAVWTSDVSASLGQILPRKQYPYGYDAWNYTQMPRSSAKYTVLGYYMPRSGGFSLFYESDEVEYASGACLKVEEDQKTIAYYNAYDSGNNSYVYETLESPLIFGDCLAYVFDCGSVKVYRNKELLFERQIEDESYLSGNLTHFSNLLGGDNYKKSFLLSVGNAFPLEDEYYYSISDFVNGVEPTAGYLSKLSSINAPFKDATGLTLSQVTGTYSQSFSDETSCAKFVPSGLSSTSKKVRYFNFKAPYANEKNATCKIRMKFYLPTSNANWKHIGFKPVGSYATWKEISNLLDANDCISAKDEWQTLEFTLKNGNGTFAPKFYFRPDSGTTTTSAAIGQAIASAGSDVFYLAEYVVEYPPAIDNYVKIPTQNGVFLQKGTIPYNMVFGLGMYASSYCDINHLGDSGANNARSIAASQTLTSNPYLYVDSFDFVPYGRYCLSSITLKFADLSALADTDTITLPAIDSSYRDMTFTKSEVLNGQITIHCENPNSYDLRSNDNYWNVSMYAGSGVELSGDIIFNWERIN